MQTYGRIIVDQPGPPDVMRWVQEPVKQPAPTEVRVRNEAIGVDFIDTQIRAGQLPAAMPTGLGYAAVGVVEEVGQQVSHVKKGDRVGYMFFSGGSYAEERLVPGDRVVRLPDQNLAANLAAGALFRGLTAWYLSHRLRQVNRGDVVLVHAAAGGVGLILTQWLRHLGATVVGTVDSREKADVLRANGCEHAVIIPQEDFVAKVKEVSGGQGAAIVYESIGKATIEGSLDSAKRFGLIASFGWPSGDPEVPLMTLRNKGSLFITRPTVSQYMAEPADLQAGATALFTAIQQGVLQITVGNQYPLRDAAKAHTDLVAGRTVGSVVLIP